MFLNNKGEMQFIHYDHHHLHHLLAFMWIKIFENTFNSREGQRTNQKYRNLVGSDQQMQRLEETGLRKADRTVGVNCNIFSNISSGMA